MEKYELKEPKKSSYGWYVTTSEYTGKNLRPSGEMKFLTGYSKRENVGYWDTYEEALKAKEDYEKKQSESELVFPEYYMYIGDGAGYGDILYCKTKDDCKLVYAEDIDHEEYAGIELEINDWSKMKFIPTYYAEQFGLNEHKQNHNVNEFFTKEVLESFQKNGMFNDFGKMNAHAIQQERESDYGDAQESFDSIADFWSNYLSRKTQLTVKLDAIDVALMMNLFKISRNAYKRKEDNFVDGESYANFGTRFFEENYETVS